MRILTVGTKVKRNPKSWPYGNQDVDKYGHQTIGTIVGIGPHSYFIVWDNGHRNTYAFDNVIRAYRENKNCSMSCSCWFGCDCAKEEPDEEYICYKEYEPK